MKNSTSNQAGERTHLTGLLPEKFETRLFCIARSEYNNSSYGHGKFDGQSAEVAVASEIEKEGTFKGDEAYDIAVEIVARVTSQVDEENAAIYAAEAATRDSRNA